MSGVETGNRKITIVNPTRQTLALLADWNGKRDSLKKSDPLYAMMQSGFLGDGYKPEPLPPVPGDRRTSLFATDYYVNPHSEENTRMLRVGIGVLVNLASVYLGAQPEDIRMYDDSRAILTSIGLSPRNLVQPLVPFTHFQSGDMSEEGYFADMKEVGKAANIVLNKGIDDICMAIERLSPQSPLRGMYDKMTSLLTMIENHYGITYETRYIRSSSKVANFLNTGVSTSDDTYMLALRTAYRQANGDISETERFFEETTIPSQLATLFVGIFNPTVAEITGEGDTVLPEYVEFNAHGKMAIERTRWQKILDRQGAILKSTDRYRTGCPAFPETILFIQRYLAANSRAGRQTQQAA